MTFDAFHSVPFAEPDEIFGVVAAYRADSASDKINAGPGVYKSDEGEPWLLPVVKKVSKILSVDNEYIGITGIASFHQAAAKLMLGEGSKALSEGRVASTQTISGTGANHLAAAFLKRLYPFPSGKPQVYITNPRWLNTPQVFRNVGIEPVYYSYYDPVNQALDLDGFKASLEGAEDGSIFLLHGCAHNPTGVDPTAEQRREIIELMLRKKHFAFFDCAYQGFASGDIDDDAAAVRQFEASGIPLVIYQSFSKNTGLYNSRTGALHVVSSSSTSTKSILSQLAAIQRSEVSSPPAWGARVVSMILNTPELFEEWKLEVKVMAERMKWVRAELRGRLEALGTPGNWEYITRQIGMFSIFDLSAAQIKTLNEQHHIYFPSFGRVSMTGLNSSNIERFAAPIDSVVRGSA